MWTLPRCSLLLTSGSGRSRILLPPDNLNAWAHIAARFMQIQRRGSLTFERMLLERCAHTHSLRSLSEELWLRGPRSPADTAQNPLLLRRWWSRRVFGIFNNTLYSVYSVWASESWKCTIHISLNGLQLSRPWGWFRHQRKTKRWAALLRSVVDWSVGGFPLESFHCSFMLIIRKQRGSTCEYQIQLWVGQTLSPAVNHVWEGQKLRLSSTGKQLVSNCWW